MIIQVVEGRMKDGKEVIAKAEIDEYEFVRLYGEKDFKILLQRGEVGDTIGEMKWYYAKLVKVCIE